MVHSAPRSGTAVSPILAVSVSILIVARCWWEPAVGASPSAHDHSVVFENSASDLVYFHSSGTVIRPSVLDMEAAVSGVTTPSQQSLMVGGKCPVETGKFVSPGNSLRLTWKSAPGGDWRMRIHVADRYGRRFELHGDSLQLWCYSQEGLSVEEAPRIGVEDSDGNSLPDVSLLAGHGPLRAGEWNLVRVPFADFRGPFQGTDASKFDARHLAAVTFVQGLDDPRRHTLLVDDIRVGNRETRDRDAPAAPGNLSVVGQDSHFDLHWLPNVEDDLCSYRVYRSWDGEAFTPVHTRPARFQRCVDFVGKPARTAYYRVTAIDRDHNESPPSLAASATTRPFDDEELLTMVQEGCFRYYWEAAHAESGLAIEILPGDEDLVAVGASGFGIMALLVGTEREFITRDQSVARLLRMVRFLREADRFHGAWPHFLSGRTGRVRPYFGRYDNGGDLVETAFLVQGLLAARQYFDRDTAAEREIRDTITILWRDVEWDWYRQSPDSEVLYWHWSPDHGWHIGHPLVGWNETMIVYLLAIASPTHRVPASLYDTGWAGQSDLAVRYRRNWSRTTDGDHYANGNRYYGIPLDVGSGNGGELFFTQFSFLGFDPRGKRDRFTDYFENNRRIALINRAYCQENPRQRVGYGPACWGRSAGIHSGGGRPLPRDDNGTICCSAALGSFPYTPVESMQALRHFYRVLGAKVWGVYGFHDGFNQTEAWYDEVYMGLNQAQIVVMMENYRTGLVWRHFMANPEMEPMLRAIGFRSEEGS